MSIPRTRLKGKSFFVKEVNKSIIMRVLLWSKDVRTNLRINISNEPVLIILKTYRTLSDSANNIPKERATHSCILRSLHVRRKGIKQAFRSSSIIYGKGKINSIGQRRNGEIRAKTGSIRSEEFI